VSEAGPAGPGLGQLLQKAREMQERVQRLQRDLAQRRVEGSAGGGMVTAVASGALRVLEIRIEPGLIAGGDREMIQDLCAAAVNAALANAQRMAQEELQQLGALGPTLSLEPTGGRGGA
jgi:DNA-binding YbaB/EbfC family protein